MSKKNTKQIIISIFIVITVIFAGYFSDNIYQRTSEDTINQSTTSTTTTQTYSFDLESVPEYYGEPYVAINNNVPGFDESEYTTEVFETYSELDYLGRCGVAYANICQELMPTKGREDISDVEPTGWIQAKYDGEYLYNRCHLIGHQLAGEDANEKNLITGTRYLNIEGMLPFENDIADYVEETDNHVLYRVTPVFEDNNLVASGVQMEGYSVEDNGEGICFNIYCYNIEPNINIDYSTGESCYIN